LRYDACFFPLASHAHQSICIQSAAALAVLLDENKDEQILKEACLGLCQLFGEGIQNDRIQAILEADVVPRLVALLKPNRSRNVPVSVQSAALQVIGNVACGDDRQTQVIIDCDALPCLKVRFHGGRYAHAYGEFRFASPLTLI
jgi:Armadillo/beta-catenin-like repeat